MDNEAHRVIGEISLIKEVVDSTYAGPYIADVDFVFAMDLTIVEFIISVEFTPKMKKASDLFRLI